MQKMTVFIQTIRGCICYENECLNGIQASAVDILTFMNMINFKLSWDAHEKNVYCKPCIIVLRGESHSLYWESM